MEAELLDVETEAPDVEAGVLAVTGVAGPRTAAWVGSELQPGCGDGGRGSSSISSFSFSA